MKKLLYKDLVSIGLGLIIGSGVITLTGFGIGYTDTGIFFAYILAGILFFISLLPTLIVGTCISRTSFSYSITKDLLSNKASGMYLMLFFIGRIILAFFGVSFASYLDSIIPGLNKTMVAIGVITFFYIINLLGVSNANKIQKLLNIFLLVALISFVGLGLAKLQPDALSSTRLFPNGLKGMMQAVVLIMFPMGGGFSLLEFGGSVDNPQKTLPKAILTVTIVAMILFALIGLAGSGVLPYEQVANQPLTIAAKFIYPIKAGFIFFIVGGALLAIATTMNSSLMWYTQTMIKGVEDGWFPKSIAIKNKNDAPYILLSIFYLMGVFPILLGWNIVFLANVATGLALLFYIIPNFSLINLPKKYPDIWNKSIYKKLLPNQLAVNIFTLFCSSIFLYLIYYNFSKFNNTIKLSIAAALIISFIYILIQEKKNL